MNRITLQAMRFETLFNPRVQDSTIGYIIHDDCDIYMEDILNFTIEGDKPLEFLENAYLQAIDDDNDRMVDMFHQLHELRNGICINGTHFTYDAIKHLCRPTDE